MRRDNAEYKAGNDKIHQENASMQRKCKRVQDGIRESAKRAKAEQEKLRQEIEEADRQLSVSRGAASEKEQQREKRNAALLGENEQIRTEIEAAQFEVEKLVTQKTGLTRAKEDLEMGVKELREKLREKEARLKEISEKSAQAQNKARSAKKVAARIPPPPAAPAVISAPVRKAELERPDVMAALQSARIGEDDEDIMYTAKGPAALAEPVHIVPAIPVSILGAPKVDAAYAHVLDEMSIPDPEPRQEPQPQMQPVGMPAPMPMMQPAMVAPGGMMPMAPVQIMATQPMAMAPAAAATAPEPPAAPVSLEMRYKKCLCSAKEVWFQDQALQIGIMRQVNKSTKQAVFKAYFGNKHPDAPVIIRRFDLGAHDDKGMVGVWHNSSCESQFRECSGHGGAQEPGGVHDPGADCQVLLHVPACSLRLRVLNAGLTIPWDRFGGTRNSASLKIPVNILMFCQAVPASAEDVARKMEELKDTRVNGHFDLDTARLRSMTQLRQAVAMEDAVNILDNGAGVALMATEFPNDKGKSIQAFAQIHITKSAKQCTVSVCSASATFRDVVTRNLLDIIANK